MNATPRILPAFIPDAGAAASASASQSAFAFASGPSFASTLKELGTKSGRKSAAAKPLGGESMPQAGNASPPVPPPSRTSTSLESRSTAKVGDAGTVAKPNSVASTTASDRGPASSSPGSRARAGDVTASTAYASQPAASGPDDSIAEAPTVPGVAATGASPAAAPPADPAGIVTPPAAPGGSAAVGKSGVPTAAGRPNHDVKAALKDPGLIATAPDAGDDAGDSVTSPIVVVATAAAGVEAAAAPPSVDTSAAAALAALAGSRNAYATAASDAADDAAATVAGLSGVATAVSSDDAMKASAVSAADAAVQAQFALLAGDGRADKHASPSVDATPVNGNAEVAAGLSQPGSTAGAVPDATPTPTLRVATSIDSSDFPQELSARVAYMVDNNLNGAKLQVNPPQLGPIELRIMVSGEHAQVWMSTHSAVTRDALESSAPKLREMLGTQGFSQVSVEVSQRSFQERSAHSQPYENTATSRSGASTAATQNGVTATRNAQGILDAYA